MKTTRTATLRLRREQDEAAAMLAIERGELIGEDGRMHYLYNVGDEGPTSLRISSSSYAAAADASTPPPPAFAPFSHPIQNYLSDGGVSPAPLQPSPHQPTAAEEAYAGPGGFYVFDDAEAMGYGEETPRRRGGDDDDDDSAADEQEEVRDDEVDYEVDDEDEEDEEACALSTW